LAKGVMDRVCREGDGLFPSPREIKLSCSCPDWADMCKHVAAVLYGVGARLDQMPRLLFVLRGVDENELIAGAGRGVPLSKAAPGAAKVLDDQAVAALFGLEMAEAADPGAASAPVRAQRLKAVKGGKPSTKNKPSTKKKTLPAKPNKLPRASRSKPEPKLTPAVHARKRHDRAA
jgi:uncharacterized Zn finger protein